MTSIVVSPLLMFCVCVTVSPVIIEAPPLQPVIVEGEGEEVVVKCIVMGWNYDVTWTVGGTVIASTNSSTPSEHSVTCSDM